MRVLVSIKRRFYVVICPHCFKILRWVRKSECYGVVGAAKEAVTATEGTCWECGTRLTGFEQE